MWVSIGTRSHVLRFFRSPSLIVSQCNWKFYVPCAPIFSYVSIKHWNSIFPAADEGAININLKSFSYYVWMFGKSCQIALRTRNFCFVSPGAKQFNDDMCCRVIGIRKKFYTKVYCGTLSSLWAFSMRIEINFEDELWKERVALHSTFEFSRRQRKTLSWGKLYSTP